MSLVRVPDAFGPPRLITGVRPMTARQAVRALQMIGFLLLLTSCGPAFFAPHPESHTKHLATIDLSAKSGKCDTTFRWPDPYPSLALTLSDSNGATRAFGTHPDWPLELQLDVVDKRSGAVAVSTKITKDQMEFANWDPPATCLAVALANWYNVLQKGHSYRLVLTVLHEQKELGPARVTLQWVTGGDSL